MYTKTFVSKGEARIFVGRNLIFARGLRPKPPQNVGCSASITRSPVTVGKRTRDCLRSLLCVPRDGWDPGYTADHSRAHPGGLGHTNAHLPGRVADPVQDVASQNPTLPPKRVLLLRDCPDGHSVLAEGCVGNVARLPAF